MSKKKNSKNYRKMQGNECDTKAPTPRVVTRTITDGRTDGRTMAAGSSVTWTHCSVRYEVTRGKTLLSARMRLCIRASMSASERTGSVHAMDAKGLHKGSSNIPFSLLHHLGLKKLRCVWCTSWSGLR
jgi:hypothetical protein